MNSSKMSLALILFTVTTNAAAQIMLKRGLLALGPISYTGMGDAIPMVMRVVFSPWVFLGLSTFVLSMATHLVVLSRVELSFAYPFLSLAYIMVATYAYFILGEDVGAIRAAGYGLICMGTLLIALS